MNGDGQTLGPRHALIALYQSQFAGLLAHLRRLLGDAGQAQDLAQQAGLKLLELPPEQISEIRDPRAFLFQIASNLARDQLRRRLTAQAGQAALRAAPPPAVAGPDRIFDQQEQLIRLRAAIARLPEQARRVLLLARIEGFSHKEIAVRLGIQPKTVENHLGRALALLAQHLDKHDD